MYIYSIPTGSKSIIHLNLLECSKLSFSTFSILVVLILSLFRKAYSEVDHLPTVCLDPPNKHCTVMLV